MNLAPFGGVIAGGARLISGVQVSWRDGPLPERQSVIFANHTSHLDFVVLWSSLPRSLRKQTRPVAAQDYWEHGLRRAMAVDVFNAILIPRGQGGASREVGAQAAERRPVASCGVMSGCVPAERAPACSLARIGPAASVSVRPTVAASWPT